MELAALCDIAIFGHFFTFSFLSSSVHCAPLI